MAAKAKRPKAAAEPTSIKKTSEHDRLLGQRLRSRRMQMKMTQGQLGNALGLTFQQIQKYEKGTNRISTSRMIEIAKVLKTELQYFTGDLEDSSSEYQHSPFQEFMATRDHVHIVEAMMVLPSTLRKCVIELARGLSECAAIPGLDA